MKDAGSGEPCGAPEKVLGSCRKIDGHTFCCLPSPRFKLKATRLLLGAGGVPWLMLAAGGESLPGIVELRAAPCSRHASESVAARMLYRLPGPWPAAFRERQVQAGGCRKELGATKGSPSPSPSRDAVCRPLTSVTSTCPQSCWQTGLPHTF